MHIQTGPKPLDNMAFTPKLVQVLREGYGLRQLRGDAFAGLTVAIVALPLAMALAIASGATPDKGLVTAIVAGFLISTLGGSRVQIGGPTGAFVVVVFNVIAQHGYDGLLLATMIAGVLLIIAGYARLGQVIKFVPQPVITGFTAGIAIIIASAQVKDFFGLSLDKVPADFIPKWVAYADAASQGVNVATLGIGIGALGVILLLRQFAPRAPGYLIAILLASLGVVFFHLDVPTIGSRFPMMPRGLSVPSLPSFSLEKIQEVLPSAFTIAFLAGIEALLSAIVADGMTGFRHRSNQELVGQGVANIASALFGGLPATGALARTATNVRAGGRTPFAGMFHALFLLIFLAVAAPFMKYVPLAALAAILFVVAYGMSELERFRHLLKAPFGDRVVLLLTFGLTVLVDLTVAIGVGVGLASLLFMGRMAQAFEITTGQKLLDDKGVSETGTQRDTLPAGVEVFRISGPFFFGVANELMDSLSRIGQMPKVFILRMRLVPLLDASGASALDEFVKRARRQGTAVILSGIQSQPAEVLQQMGMGPDTGIIYYVDRYEEAVKQATRLVTQTKPST